MLLFFFFFECEYCGGWFISCGVRCFVIWRIIIIVVGSMSKILRKIIRICIFGWENGLGSDRELFIDSSVIVSSIILINFSINMPLGNLLIVCICFFL